MTVKAKTLAGTLVPGAYARKGFVRFLADRAVRLGVPSLVFMLVLDPLTNIIREIATGVGFSWTAFLPGYRDFVLSGRFLSASGPPWFAVALLVFSVVYAVARLVADLVRAGASRRVSTGASAARSPSPRVVGIAATCMVAVIALAAFLVRLVQPLGTSVMNMQIGYFASYVVLFVVGLRAGRTGLLQAIPAKAGRTWLWLSIGHRTALRGCSCWPWAGPCRASRTCSWAGGTGRRPASPRGNPSSAWRSASACSPCTESART